MMFGEITGFYCKNYTKFVHTYTARCNAMCLNVTAGGTCNYHWTLNG